MHSPSRILLSSVFILACSWGAHTPLLGQDNAGVTLSFPGLARTIQQNFTLTPGHYTGEKGKIVFRSAPGQSHLVEISGGSLLEDASLTLDGPTQLVLHGALLRRCQIVTSARSTLIIQNCVFDRCEFNGTGDKTAGYGSIEAIGSVFSGCGWQRPVNWLGLKMQNCTLLHMKNTAMLMKTVSSIGSMPADLARQPALRQCRFTASRIPNSLLSAVAECVFDDCEHYPPPAPNAPSATAGNTEDVQVAIAWDNCRPAQPVAPGKGVRLVSLESRDAAGATLEHGWDGQWVFAPSIKPAGGVQNFFASLDAALPAASPQNMAGATAVKLRQTQVNGLLVMPLASGKEAGALTRMTLTAVPGFGSMRFTQPVGTDMQTALQAVNRFMELRHQQMPRENDFEIGFQEKYADKDGPSAAVACALLLESVITGKTWDGEFAVTGDMNQDGSVQPIGGVAAKIRGAANGDCKIVAIPMKNESALMDVLLMDGPNALCKTAVFGISNFEEAAALAATERPQILQQALDEFMVMREVLLRDPRAQPQILRTPQAVERLQAILKKTVHCLSAKHLLLYAQGRLPASLSISGSIQETDASGQALLHAIKQDFNSVSSLRPDDVGGAINRLRNLRPRLDKRVWPYLDSLVNYGEILRGVILNPIRSNARADDFRGKVTVAVNNIQSTKQALLADPQVVEELGL